jgi:WD40 repeat protein
VPAGGPIHDRSSNAWRIGAVPDPVRRGLPGIGDGRADTIGRRGCLAGRFVGAITWAVSWSPTGEWIVYTRQHGTRSVISLVRPDGTENKEISATDGSDEAAGAVWSPNGEALLVLRRADAGDDLWIMDLGGNYIGRVTDETSTYGSYSWAPLP